MNNDQVQRLFDELDDTVRVLQPNEFTVREWLKNREKKGLPPIDRGTARRILMREVEKGKLTVRERVYDSSVNSICTAFKIVENGQ